MILSIEQFSIFKGYIYKQLPDKEVEEEAYLKKLAKLYGKYEIVCLKIN